MPIPDLCALSAREQHALIARREVSCAELLTTHLDWIAEVNPAVNAICTLVPDLALQQARTLDASLAAGAEPGPLAGLPAGIKDLVDTAGIRTTHGSPLFADHVPGRDALHVARLRAAGAVIVGKTNTPEWGAGSQTFNTLFGVTATPYDLGRTSGGSSGGAAAALAARMLPVADGSDFGGSLRNPAAFCNVVGFRPTPGRVPAPERLFGWSPLPVLGPMGRTVADAALLLSVMAGFDPRDPLARHEDPQAFAGDLDADVSGWRIAWSEDLGFLPVAAAVRETFRTAQAHFSDLGCRVVEAEPDLTDAPEIFRTLRALSFAAAFGRYLQEQPEKLKDTVRWNTALGLALTAEEVARAEAGHTALYRRALAFFEDHDFLVLPTTQVLPFPKTEEWVREIDGVVCRDYLQWMESCCLITLTGAPAISMPCGFSAGGPEPHGLPVGLQIVGRPGADLAVLRLAQAFERAAPFGRQTPALDPAPDTGTET
ncbi:MAG: amidase [Pseudomonadales bacterium]|jgi:amidase